MFVVTFVTPAGATQFTAESRPLIEQLMQQFLLHKPAERPGEVNTIMQFERRET